MEAIFSLGQLMGKYQEEEKSSNGLLDLEKAYDKVLKVLIWQF